MKQYRLKKEAYPFFSDKVSKEIASMAFWIKQNVNETALEEVEDINVSYGHVHHDFESKHTSLAGWSQDGSRLHFTINFPSIKFVEHDKFTKGRHIRDLMNIIQEDVNQFYINFLMNEDEGTK